MYKFCLFCSLCLLMSCCSTKDINKKVLNSVCEINIQNRTSDIYGGIKELNIKDKKQIDSICKELFFLKEENNSLQTKPYDGTILIRFIKKDRDGMNEYINILTTRIILKPNSEYFMTNSSGQYISDHFLAKILKYLEIDESKVSALDNYRKSSGKK